MNNLYQWQNEAMVALKMDERKREMDSIRLLHDASLSNSGWFERTVIAVGNSLSKFGQHLHKDYIPPDCSPQATGSKHAA